MIDGRFAAIFAIAHRLCLISGSRRDLFLQIRSDVLNLASRYEIMVDGSSTPINNDHKPRDPNVMKTK